MRIAVLFLVPLIFCHCTTPPPEPTPQKSEEIRLASIDREEIRKTFSRHQRYIRNCYQKTLVDNPDKKMNGMVVLDFSIDASGRGKSPKVVEKKTTLNDPSLHRCLYAGISSWDWPVARHGQLVNVIYPLKFNDSPPADMQKKLDQFRKLRKQ